MKKLIKEINEYTTLYRDDTTGSYVIKVPERYTAMVMEGNGFTWFIMPVDVKDGKDKGETIIV